MNSYIVVFKSADVSVSSTDEHIESCAQSVEQSGGTIKHRYASKVIRGFAGTMTEEKRKELELMETVSYVEPDGPVSI